MVVAGNGEELFPCFVLSRWCDVEREKECLVFFLNEINYGLPWLTFGLNMATRMSQKYGFLLIIIKL